MPHRKHFIQKQFSLNTSFSVCPLGPLSFRSSAASDVSFPISCHNPVCILTISCLRDDDAITNKDSQHSHLGIRSKRDACIGKILVFFMKMSLGVRHERKEKLRDNCFWGKCSSLFSRRHQQLFQVHDIYNLGELWDLVNLVKFNLQSVLSLN